MEGILVGCGQITWMNMEGAKRKRPGEEQVLAKELMHPLETGDPLHPTLEMDFHLEAVAILDAGIRSAASGKVELVNDATWCIG